MIRAKLEQIDTISQQRKSLQAREEKLEQVLQMITKVSKDLEAEDSMVERQKTTLKTLIGALRWRRTPPPDFLTPLYLLPLLLLGLPPLSLPRPTPFELPPPKPRRPGHRKSPSRCKSPGSRPNPRRPPNSGPGWNVFGPGSIFSKC